MLNEIQKILLIVILLGYTDRVKEEKPEKVEKLLSIFKDPIFEDELTDMEGNKLLKDGELTNKGFALAYRIKSLKIDYKKVVAKASFNHAVAALFGCVEGFFSHLDKNPLYTGTSAHRALVGLQERLEKVINTAVDKKD